MVHNNGHYITVIAVINGLGENHNDIMLRYKKNTALKISQINGCYFEDITK